MISHMRISLRGPCCVCIVGTGRCMYMCAFDVKASPPPCSQIYGAESGQADREKGRGGGRRRPEQETGTWAQEGGDAGKICGVQWEYVQEMDNSGEMGDLIKYQENWHNPGRRNERIFVKKITEATEGKGGGGVIQEFCTQSGLNGVNWLVD